MKRKRRRHDPEFKARVALKALKGGRTIQEIAGEYGIHPVQVSEWKKMMAANAAVEALEQALRTTGRRPGIFNTDQGSQFTCSEWIGRFEGLGVKLSMDGKGRWMDNVFIERLWRSVKYECVYLHGHGTLTELRCELQKWFGRYNTWRPHDSLGNLTPSMVYDLFSVAA